MVSSSKMGADEKKKEIVSSDPAWPRLFNSEASLMKEALGDNCLAIHHIGSTAVSGLIAKPTIDVLVVVEKKEGVVERLESIGYRYRGEYNIPQHYGFSKRERVKYNVHLFQEGHPEIELNLTFRDYLRSHPQICQDYADLKRALHEQKGSFRKNNSMFAGYTLGKDAFIRKILKLAGYSRLRFMRCVHHYEWEKARELCSRSFDEAHEHLVLYKGVDVIGYMELHMKSSQNVVIDWLVIEESERGNGYGRWFIKSVIAWLKELGIVKIGVYSPKIPSWIEQMLSN